MLGHLVYLKACAEVEGREGYLEHQSNSNSNSSTPIQFIQVLLIVLIVLIVVLLAALQGSPQPRFPAFGVEPHAAELWIPAL